LLAGRLDTQVATLILLQALTVDPNVCGGRPCIRGLRIRVADVLNLLAGGAAREQILADYPYLEAEDIVAALQFAGHLPGIVSAVQQGEGLIEID
jgi:uncharacterized protein (DUF433 family)